MKKVISFVLFATAGSFSVLSQTTMNIYKSNGTILYIPLADIDSINYTGSTQLASLATLPISNVTGSTAETGGDIFIDGGNPVTQRGVVYSTVTNPMYDGITPFTNDGSGIGTFTSNLTGLLQNTIYYVKAYAITAAGTAYGNEVTFTAGVNYTQGAGVTIDGYTYPTIVYGNGQEWMAENLNTTVYNDGTPIPVVSDATSWSANYNTGATNPMMSWQNFDQVTWTSNHFNALYNWYAIDPASNGSRNVCPIGWHVPTQVDFCALLNFIDPAGNCTTSGAGGNLKSLDYWNSPNAGATNSSGFTGYPGGNINETGGFDIPGNQGNWWSATEVDSNNSWYLFLGAVGSQAFMFPSGYTKNTGASVRCTKD